MNGFQDKVKEAMQNKTVVPLEAYPQTIKRSVYFRILLDGNAIAKQDHHFTQALYCSMHLFALIESQDQAYMNLEQDEIPLTQDIYEDILKTIAQGNRRFCYFAWKNALISIVMGLIVYWGIVYGLDYSWQITAPCGIIVLLLDLYANGKTNETRYQKKMVKHFERQVDRNLLQINQKYQKQIQNKIRNCHAIDPFK